MNNQDLKSIITELLQYAQLIQQLDPGIETAALIKKAQAALSG